MAALRRRVASACILVAASILAVVPRAQAGPISPLYLTGLRVGGVQSHTNAMMVVQGDNVIGSWNTYGSTLPIQVMESALAVSSGIRTIGGTICSGGCEGEWFPTYSADYALNGDFEGSSALSVVPLAYPGQSDYLYDGTTDGVHNYALGTLTRNVYAFDSNWANPSVLFTLEGSGGIWVGITYDPGDDSLWVSSQNSLANYGMDGTLLGSFFVADSEYSRATGLALDPADRSLWLVRGSSPFAVGIEQYSRQGALLSTMTAAELQNLDSVGAEFSYGDGSVQPVPEPASLLLLGTGLAAAGVVRRRRR